MVMNYREISRQVRKDAKFETGTDLVDQFVSSLGEKGLLPKRLEEPRLPQVELKAKAEVLSASEDLRLQSVVQEYNTKPHTPELVTNFWQIFLGSSIKGQGLDIPVPVVSCDRTSEELETLKKEEKMWVPETGLTYSQLGQIFPRMRNYAVQDDSPIKDEFEQDTKGVDVEASIDSPNRNTKKKDLEKLFKSQGRNGMRLSTYILVSQGSKILTGHYLDEGSTWSRLLGSGYGGYVVNARFSGNGCLYVDWYLHPGGRHSGLGSRSEGVKKLSLLIP